jgi:putative MATE family efflux protein
VLRLALPIIGEQFLLMLVQLTDVWIAGRMESDVLAGLSVAAFLSWLMSTLFSAVAVGSTALVSRAVGAGDYPLARAATRQSLLLGLTGGVIAAAAGELYSADMMAAMGLTGPAAEYGATWLRITGWAWVANGAGIVGSACLRGAGDTRTPMLVMLGVNAINLSLALGLSFGFGPVPALGAIGIAVGTAVARSCGGVAMLAVLAAGWGRATGDEPLRATPWPLTPDLGLMARILRVGLPNGAETLLNAAGMAFYYRVVTQLGTASVAAHGLTLRTEAISYLPGFAFATAAATLVGQALGADRPALAARSAWRAFGLGAMLMGAMAVVFAVAAEPLVALFAPGHPDVVALAGSALRLISLGQVPEAAAFIFAGALRGAGDTRAPMVITGVGLLLVRLPLAQVFALPPEAVVGGLGLGWGLWGAWLAMLADLCFRGTWFTLRFVGGRWKAVRV